jgi:hypothetical protein
VVREGRILKKIEHLQKVSFFYARFTPGFGEKSGILIGKFIGLFKKSMN